jgi:ribosomal-protein-alanine N-acetyltransferase
MAVEPIQVGISHAGAMAAIHRTAFAPREAWGRDAIGLQLAMPGVAGWCHPDGGMILARVAADQMEVLTLAVSPEVRHQGIGMALLRAAIGWGRSCGAATAFLEVAEDNPAARELYARAGFVPAGRRPKYYASGADALVLRLPLTDPDAGATG